MAKRLIDTGLVSQNWYMNLNPKQKALYIHLLCSCDVAGVFEINYGLMSAYIGEKITERDLFDAFGNRVIPLTRHNDKGMIVDFVSFQCGGRLNPNVKVHQSILKRLGELGISVSDLQKWCNHTLEYSEAVQPVKVTNILKERPVLFPEPEEIVQPEQEKVQYDYEAAFNEFYGEYPRHDSKQAAYLKFMRLMKECKKDGDRDLLLRKMIGAVRVQKRSEQWTKDNGKFIPMPSTWLNQRRWEDEGLVDINAKNEEAKSVTIASIVERMKV